MIKSPFHGSSKRWGVWFRYQVAAFFIVTSFFKAQEKPTWYFSPPQSDNLFYAIGLSPKYQNDKDSFAAAQENAIGNLTREIKVRLISGSASVSSSSSYLEQSYAIELIDSTIYNSVSKNAVPIDSINYDGYAYYLMAIRRNLKKPVASSINQWIKSDVSLRDYDNEKGKPTWISILPKRKGIIFSVGMSSNYLHLNDCWDNSAKNARVNLAKEIQVRIKSMSVDYETGVISQHKEWIEETTNVELNDTPIIERWYDKNKNLYYTLIEHKLRN